MRRLNRNEVLAFKQGLYRKQGGICPLCEEKMASDLGKCALDHDHITGEVRGLLHVGCNLAEGKVFHAVATWGGQGRSYAEAIPYMKRLIHYLETSGEGVQYHLHKDPDEKAEAQRKRTNARARARRAIKKRS